MGSLPNLSVVKGPTRHLQTTRVNKLFENLAQTTAADNFAVIFEGITTDTKH